LHGRNEHFQAFELQFAKSKDEKVEGNIQFLSKTRLFTTPQSTIAKKEGYQRIVRLSPPTRTKNAPNRRIGVIASGLAGDENEIVIFSATSNKPTDQDVIGRITLHKGQEANDLDIFTQEEGRFRVAYVTDQDVFIQNINYDFEQKKTTDTNEHRKVYTIPPVSSGPRSKLRCIRWVSPKHLLLLSNKPNRTGVEMKLLHLYEEGPGMIASRKTLPKHVKAATDMDVAFLDADDEGAYQIAIAVGGK
jgi:prolactin regulatory element-binding protein